MAQIHPPLTSVAPPSVPLATRAARASRVAATPAHSRWVDGAILLALVAAAFGIVTAASRWAAPLTPNTHIDLSPRSLPLYGALSTLRMALAYGLSLAFSLVYARIAAASRGAERVMVPVLDILQSIPILSFLPGLVLGLVALFPRSNTGLELAAVLAIFTSQAWNMAFSVYHSLLVIPDDAGEFFLEEDTTMSTA